MPRINLLPWREELRKQRQKEFGVMAFLAALAMAGVVAAGQVQLGEMIAYQNQRNQFLDQQIAKLDKKIREIRDLKKEKENLIARMRIVERLQTSRPEVVHMFDEVVEALPEGVYLTSLSQSGRSISLNGIAQSNARVSSFMRALESSEWLENPDLKMIQATSRQTSAGPERLSQFTLVVTQITPKGAKEVEGASP